MTSTPAVEPSPASEFVVLDPRPTWCGAYGSGTCCYDQHLRASVVVKSATPGQALCDEANDTLTVGRLTDNKDLANCQACRELIHS
jgi:hypothetical protein